MASREHNPDELLKLVEQDRLEDALDVPIREASDKVGRRFRLLAHRHRSDDELTAALSRAWAVLRSETPKDLMERLCRVGHMLVQAGDHDAAIRYLETAIRLPGDKAFARKVMASCLNARAVEKANRAGEMLNKSKKALLEKIVHGRWL
jgi:hypothetical protein